jgi:hypothetical protein
VNSGNGQGEFANARVPNRLRMRFPVLAPMVLVELLCFTSRNRQRPPLFPSVDSDNLNDLADRIAGVA